ncbi:MAG: hypothetical protein GWO38_27610, partial [Phycisphaerae bacterium]|nr:hypothetical protein [Phycisphaerae bacterium]NIX01531.1 hypothetical protein [Phycisphaerae bacterium]NIX31292.1 hypothetical protein [Phycisphaerae bacterium]
PLKADARKQAYAEYRKHQPAFFEKAGVGGYVHRRKKRKQSKDKREGYVRGSAKGIDRYYNYYR